VQALDRLSDDKSLENQGKVLREVVMDQATLDQVWGEMHKKSAAGMVASLSNTDTSSILYPCQHAFRRSLTQQIGGWILL
jgi:hypothetical protein